VVCPFVFCPCTVGNKANLDIAEACGDR